MAVIKKIICAVLTVAALFSCASAGNVSAGSAILIDAASGEALFTKNAEERRLIASTTKIMTALVVIENCSLDDVVKIPEACERVGGSSMYLRAGEEVTVEHLLYGLLLMSGNDAGYALAYHCGNGKVDEFVMKMNMYAEELGLLNTSFENPHGLDGKSNYSTAADMARLAAHAMNNKTFYDIVSTKQTSFGRWSMKNHNKLLWRVEGACGVKTGFTKAAGRCLVSCAERNGRRYIAVTLNAPDDWNDHEMLYKAVFNSLKEYDIITAGESAAVIPLAGGGDAEIVYGNNFSMWLTPLEYEKIEIHLNLPPFIYSFVPGRTAGSADIYVRGVLSGSVDLYYK